MNKLFLKLSAVLLTLLIFTVATAMAGGGKKHISFTEPKDGATVSSPVKVCMEAHGVTVEPAKKGINEGKGHHHLIIDTDLPSDLSKPIGKDGQHVHMGDGSTCKELKLDAGKHVIRALFARGNHVPYDPAVTGTVSVTVK